MLKRSDWVRRALTRKIKRKGARGNQHIMIVDPNEKLVYAIKFSVGTIGILTALEICHMAFLHSWNGEIFVVIASLVTFVTGIFIGQKGG